jgi:hypothetical protein
MSSSIFSERGKNSSDFTVDGLIEMWSRIPKHARPTSVIEYWQQEMVSFASEKRVGVRKSFTEK